MIYTVSIKVILEKNMRNGKINDSLITLIPEIQVDINETKKYISEITDWIYPERWSMKYRHVDKLHPIYKYLVNRLSIGNPGSIFIMIMLPKSTYQIHIDEIKNSSIMIAIDGEFDLCPINYYKNIDGKEKIFDHIYEIGVPTLINGKIPHGVQNLSDKSRTILMITIRDPHNYESVRAAYFNGTLIRRKND